MRRRRRCGARELPLEWRCGESVRPPGGGFFRGTVFRRVDCEGVQQSHCSWGEPVVDGMVDQGHDAGAFRGVAPRAGVVVRGFGPFTSLQVLPMWFPWCGRSCDHHISS